MVVVLQLQNLQMVVSLRNKGDTNTINLSTTLEGTALTLTDASENHTITATNTYAGSVVLVANQVVILDKNK